METANQQAAAQLEALRVDRLVQRLKCSVHELAALGGVLPEVAAAGS